MTYCIEVYRLGFMTYSWRAYEASTPPHPLPMAFGSAVTKRGAMRAALRWTRSKEPVLTRELP